jgi:hypothetical protein
MKLRGSILLAAVGVLCAVIWTRSESVENKPPGPTKISCEEKTYPNLPGKSAVSLTKVTGGTYRVVYEAYRKPKTKNNAACVFSDKDPLVFNCLISEGRWGIDSKKISETSIDPDGAVRSFEGYSIAAVKAPSGESQVEDQFRFKTEFCKIDQ